MQNNGKSIPGNIWFAGIVVSYREKDDIDIRIVAMSFGVRAEDYNKAQGKTEAICDRVVTEITRDNRTAAILAVRAVVSSGAGENGVIDSPDDFDFVK